MATKIGSFFYEIFADSSKLQKGLTDSKSALGQFGNKFKEITGISLGAASVFGAVSGAVYKIADYIKRAVSETDNYVSSVTDMSRMLGISVDDTSKLIQASDDLFISQERLNTALTAASRQGIDVSIQGIKKLSDEYLALSPGAERAEFLAKNFGRSGMDMGKLLEQGSVGIDKATAAISDNLVVTEESKRITYDYKRSVDGLQDAMAGISYTVGKKVMPIMTDFNVVLAYAIEKMNSSDKEATAFSNTMSGIGVAVQSVSNPIALLVNEIRIGMGLSADAIQSVDTQMEGLQKRGEALNEYYKVGNKYVEDSTAALLDYGAEYKTTTSYIGQFMDMEGKSADAVEDATNRIILSMLEQQLSADGLSEAESEYLIKMGEDLGVYSAGAVQKYKAAAAAARDYAAAISAIPSTPGISYQVAAITGSGMTAGTKQIAGQRAEGGSIFSGYSYLVGEKGPEIITPSSNGTVIPNNAINNSNALTSEQFEAGMERLMANMASIMGNQFAQATRVR